MFNLEAVFSEQEAIQAIKDTLVQYFKSWCCYDGASEEVKRRNEEVVKNVKERLKDVSTPKQLGAVLECDCTNGKEDDGSVVQLSKFEDSLGYEHTLWFRCKMNKQVINLSHTMDMNVQSKKRARTAE